MQVLQGGWVVTDCLVRVLASQPEAEICDCAEERNLQLQPERTGLPLFHKEFMKEGVARESW